MLPERRILIPLATAATLAAVLQTVAGLVVLKEPISLEDVVSGDFSPHPFLGEWISDSIYVYDASDEIKAWDVAANKSYNVVPKEVYAKYNPMKPEVSDDWNYVLFAYDGQKVFRRGPIARYVVYDMENVTIEIGGGERLQAAVWGTKQTQLAYVYQNNIYYLTEPGAEPMQLTTDGVPDVIYNGVDDSYSHASESIADMVGGDRELEFSPDGTQLAFVQCDVSLVHNASLILRYGEPGDLKDQYVTPVAFRYSKSGTPIPKFRMKLITLPSDNCTDITIQELMAPVDVVGEDHYLEFFWFSGDSIIACFSNRFRNITQYVSYSTLNKSAQLTGEKGLRVEQKDGWLEPTIVDRGNPSSFLTLVWQPQGEAGSFLHLVKVTGNSTKAITSGEVTVTDVYGWASNGTVYYQATVEGHPSRRQVYAVEEGGSPRCLSCHLISPENNTCLRASASFSKELNWFVIECTGPDPPVITIHYAPAYKDVAWVDRKNIYMRKQLAGKLLPQQLDDWVEVEGGFRAQVRLLLPPDLDPQGSEKRPALVHVYAGPDHQQVDDTFRVDLPSYFTTFRRYVVILIDGRGSGCKGDRMLFSVYRRLGSVEVEDQITVTEQLTQKYAFIDSTRVGIWGWSYGGYAAAMALGKDDDDVFKCGISVAPVTNWLYVDSAYTEWYMGLPTPEDNEAGYYAGDVTRRAAGFAGKKFLLVHGTADDLTFYQNAMMLARALQEASVLFKQQTYPDRHHWLNGRERHLYRTMDEFFRECFEDTNLLKDLFRGYFRFKEKNE